MQQTFRLVIDCPDQIGLVASVSQFLADHNATIVEASHHTDLQTGRFFMRHEISTDSLKLDHQSFVKEFAPLANEYQMNWKLSDSSKKQRVALLASLESHCLVDLLHRWHTGELHCDIPVIIGNHPQMKQFADWYKVPFHWVDFKALGKEAAFAQITTLLQEYKIDLTVLARFMQILPDTLCQELQGKAINIHHSFLPSFAGAKPYQQAYDRGVKLIGATCHYVTKDLDEGPIIEQDILRVDHGASPESMQESGYDIESAVLLRAVRLYAERRILLNGLKTVVFN